MLFADTPPSATDGFPDTHQRRSVSRGAARPRGNRSRPHIRSARKSRAPGNTDIRGYHLSRLYSPWANLAAMVRASAADTPAALQEFHNSDLGEVFAPWGGKTRS